MGRKSDLTAEEKAKIEAYVECNRSYTFIASKLGRAKSTICDFVNKKNERTSKSHSGRKKKLSPREERAIFNLATKERKSCRSILGELNLNCSYHTVYNSLVSNPNAKHGTPKCAPQLKLHHIETRKLFARKHQIWDVEWRKVMFSDEKKWNLDCPDGYSYFWHDLRKEPEFMTKRTAGGGSLMLWGAFSFNGKTDLCEIKGRNDSSSYQALIKPQLDTYFERHVGPRGIFMQDNASFHASKNTKVFFEAEGITSLDWPALSPDLNPIENMWGYLARKVYGGGRQFANVAQLRETVVKCWEEIPNTYLQTLINSMKDRIYDLIEKGGKKTRF